MRLDFQAREPHFLDHLAPVWEALPKRLRGTFHVAPDMTDRAQNLGVGVTTDPLLFDTKPVLVASLGDLRVAARQHRTCYLMEHGAGQAYSNGHPSYSGGRSPERSGVPLFLVPNEWAAGRNRRASPKARVEVVGCPKLDPWGGRKWEPNDSPVVAVSFHFDCRVCPESRWAFPHFKSGIGPLAKRFRVLGHAHPRAFDRLRRFYEAVGVEPVADFAEVLERADLYACDNSSTLFEFAATDRPVVLLNAPWYRRGVNHGLRFWDCATVGVWCDRPQDLRRKVEEALEDRPERRAERRRVTKLVFPHFGKAAGRVVGVLKEVLSD